ncbi:nucleoside ABC transporter membrane protein [Hydrogenispora ethanolica]|jgi:simple sugar transport system permease protein|uniref:Nucleoside ABC transporter membrane protein n=1 Tax=Hydrogenispora ethanolica TaxID=1082276 RepID=A0A4R1QY56_HYDET|nr:ABC transporter permease [Hydrogenispora ethanolica]TCL56810.1 nucleoside ABC transporter membrane protein [Hydrogenispora ethanolica]
MNIGTKLKEYGSKLLFPAIALFCALIAGFFIIGWFGGDPFKAYHHLFFGAFGTPTKFGETLVYVSPLILTGLGIGLAFRCGLFNIGVEGQFILGMIAAAWIGSSFTGLPAWIHIPLTMLAGILAGSIWGAIPGFLKARFGAHEVISSIMMNYMALHFTGYLVNYVLIEPPGSRPVTRMISDSAKLARFLPPSRAHLGILIALACLVLVYLFLWKTKWGFEIRAVGLNSEAARYAGINVTHNMVLAMAVSGALAGLAGALQIQGIQYRFNDLFGFPGYGLDGIAVALLGNNHPAGILFGALLFGAMNSGALEMQSVAGISKHLIGIMQAVIIFFVGADYLIKKIRAQRAVRSESLPAATPVSKEV